MQDDDEKDLVARVRNRDPIAFEKLVGKFEHVMLRTAYRIVGQQADAEEIRQNVLVRIWQSPQRLPTTSPIGYWIRRCVINEAITMLRRNERDKRKENSSVEFRLAANELSSCGDEAESLSLAMNSLTPEQRAILSLRFDDQLTIREIAKTLERPHTTIQSQLTRTIDQLRGLLKAPQRQEG